MPCRAGPTPGAGGGARETEPSRAEPCGATPSHSPPRAPRRSGAGAQQLGSARLGTEHGASKAVASAAPLGSGALAAAGGGR